MPRQIKFKRKFPDKHIDKGKDTFFVEKVLNSLGIDYRDEFPVNLRIRQFPVY